MKLALLSGDAGCGKSYAISLLVRKLRSMGISVAVSAMTNKAVGALMETCSLDQVYTFHRMMGFKKELLDDKLSLDDFTKRYRKVYGQVVFHFGMLRGSEQLPPLNIGNTTLVRRLRPESCSVCSEVLRRMRVPRNPREEAPMANAPPFLGANVLIVDEYGLMNVEILERMLSVLSVFYGPGKGPLIVFSGSVSQLQPVGSNLPVWKSERFEELLSCSTPLFSTGDSSRTRVTGRL
ncbi:hypothetical protein KUCAC02_008233 [Chaenocephalus aceratus]|uniref:Uncharacterized protein n=1 Tax=Chaenocephalus aceratus TaxID=36190 RepID=A0ACB9X9Y7_CHAAC|nr:hypothetical protein KUCAC02_008233 [Chaenocephalus aceratus]